MIITRFCGISPYKSNHTVETRRPDVITLLHQAGQLSHLKLVIYLDLLLFYMSWDITQFQWLDMLPHNNNITEYIGYTYGTNTRISVFSLLRLNGSLKSYIISHYLLTILSCVEGTFYYNTRMKRDYSVTQRAKEFSLSYQAVSFYSG